MLDFARDNKDNDNRIENKLLEVDLFNATPIEVLNILYELKQSINKGDIDEVQRSI